MSASLLMTAAALALAPPSSGTANAADRETAVTSATPSPAPADSVGGRGIGFLSAAALRERCESTSAGLVSYCFAYVAGVHDTVQAYETWLRVREFCAPANSSQSDMRRAFISYLDRNPSAGAGEAASVIVLALKDQFACAAPASAGEAAAGRSTGGKTANSRN
jgi:hypothetical protein